MMGGGSDGGDGGGGGCGDIGGDGRSNDRGGCLLQESCAVSCLLFPFRASLLLTVRRKDPQL